MSNGYQLELIRDDRDGGALLTFWDHQRGEDKVWKIFSDGSVRTPEGIDVKSADMIGKSLLLFLDWIEERIHGKNSH